MAEAPKFRKPEDIELHYAQQLAATPEELRPALEIEKARAEATFYRDQQQKTQKDVWARDVLAKYPHARIGDLKGDTEAKLEESAKEAHERIVEAVSAREAEVRAEIEKQVGRAAYAGAAAGGGNPIVDGNSPEALSQKGWAGFDNRNTATRRLDGKGGSGAPLTQAEVRARQDGHVSRLAGAALSNLGTDGGSSRG